MEEKTGNETTSLKKKAKSRRRSTSKRSKQSHKKDNTAKGRPCRDANDTAEVNVSMDKLKQLFNEII